jgi:hypothetical protein
LLWKIFTISKHSLDATSPATFSNIGEENTSEELKQVMYRLPLNNSYRKLEGCYLGARLDPTETIARYRLFVMGGPMADDPYGGDTWMP